MMKRCGGLRRKRIRVLIWKIKVVGSCKKESGSQVTAMPKSNVDTNDLLWY